MRDKLPAISEIFTCVDIDLGDAQVGGNGIAGAENGSSLKASNIMRKAIEF